MRRYEAASDREGTSCLVSIPTLCRHCQHTGNYDRPCCNCIHPSSAVVATTNANAVTTARHHRCHHRCNNNHPSSPSLPLLQLQLSIVVVVPSVCHHSRRRCCTCRWPLFSFSLSFSLSSSSPSLSSLSSPSSSQRSICHHHCRYCLLAVHCHCCRTRNRLRHIQAMYSQPSVVTLAPVVTPTPVVIRRCCSRSVLGGLVTLGCEHKYWNSLKCNSCKS